MNATNLKTMTFAALAGCLSFALQVEAATNVWSGPGAGLNNWSTPGNWSLGSAPGSGDDVKFFDTGATTVSNINNVVDTTATIGSLQYGNTNNFHTTLIAPGQTLNVTGSGGVIAGTLTDNGNAQVVTATITGPGGSLNLNNSAAVVYVSQGRAANGNLTQRATLDLGGLDMLLGTANRIEVGTRQPGGANNAQNATGTLKLARTNILSLTYAPSSYNLTVNSTNAIDIGEDDGNAGGVDFLFLGQSNAFFLDAVAVGKTKSTGTILFNPAFANNNAVAYFRGTNGTGSRVTFWSIADMQSTGSSSGAASGTNDFTGGTVDALVGTLSLGRDRSGGNTGSTVTRGTLTFTTGTIDVNTLLVGNQAFGNTGNSNPMAGVVNVNGPSATLVVNNSLVLGNTTVGSTAAIATSGRLNIVDGTVRANVISVGAASTNNLIAMTNGLMVLSNTVASPTKALTTLSMTNSTLQLAVTGVTNISVTNLVTGGATNIINPATVAVFASYPQQIPLIKYFGAAIGGVGYNFGFGANTVPPTAPGAYLSNNVANHSVDLVLPNDPRPVITSEPASYSGNPGDNVNFTAAISPSSVTPLTYQWYLGATPLADGATGNGSTLSGSLTASLAINNAQPADNGNYTLIVTNLYGAATSAPPANLTISAGCVGPSISGGPNNTTVIQGNNATLSATVAGSPLPALQWQRGGVDIQGATAASYTLTNAQYPADDQAVFCLIATNGCGKATNCATLTVIVPPMINSQPTNLVVTNTQAASFSVTASGVPAPAYQWLKNGSPIAGATLSTLTFASAGPSNAAVYSVVVTNMAGSITSTNATLLVNSTMSVTSLTPANSASGICLDTILRITFDTAPVIGSAGKIRIFNITNSTTPVDTIDLASSSGSGTQPRVIAGATYNAYPVIVSGNTATIFPHLGVLTSNQTYYVTIENVLGGVFKDSTGATFAGISANNVWQFTTRTGGPVNPTNLVVAADGSGDFCTVQGVMDFLPSGNTTPRTINIRNGIYQEIVFINGKNDLTLIGQSRDQTIITYANNDALNSGTSLRPSFRASGNDNALVNLTLTNSTPKGGTQAEALRTDGKRIVLLDVKLASFQDTMLNNNSGDLVYVRDSLIQGDTDFIWGLSTVFFTNCEIRTVTSGTQITQARTPANTNGFSFVNCQLTRPSTAVTNCGLGRDLGFTDNNVAYINCLIDGHITGWLNADARDWEYGNSNLTATAAVSYNGVQLPNNDPRLLLAKSDTNWLYGWVPQLAPIILTNPVSQSVAGGASANFSVLALGLPNPSYQWLEDGAPIPGATDSTYTIPNAYASNAASYSVIVSNTAGSITSSNATLSVGNTAPVLSPIADRTVNVGVTISFTNTASDPDAPPQALAFSLLSGPTNASVDASSGVFTWRPLVTQANSTNPISIVVSDNGSPSLSATQSFVAKVNPLAKPNISSVSTSGGQVVLKVAGDSGPDYEVQASTNLTQWQSVFITNSPPTPFQWADPNLNSIPMRFYRIVAGPPLP